MAVSSKRANTLLDKTIADLENWLESKRTRKWSDSSDVPAGLRDIPTLCEYLADLGFVPDSKRIKKLKDSIVHDYIGMHLSRWAEDMTPAEKTQLVSTYGPIRGVGSDDVEQYRWEAIVGRCLHLKEQLETVRGEISKDEKITARAAAKLYHQVTGSNPGHKWILALVNNNDPRLQLRPDGVLRRGNVLCLAEAILAERSRKRGQQSGGRYKCRQCDKHFSRKPGNGRGWCPACWTAHVDKLIP